MVTEFLSTVSLSCCWFLNISSPTKKKGTFQALFFLVLMPQLWTFFFSFLSKRWKIHPVNKKIMIGLCKVTHTTAMRGGWTLYLSAWYIFFSGSWINLWWSCKISLTCNMGFYAITQYNMFIKLYFQVHISNFTFNQKSESKYSLRA